MPPQVILVTGATGFIGRNLLSALVAHPESFTPIALTRRPSPALETLLDYPAAHDTVFTTDFSRPFDLPLSPSIVVHLAADMDFFPTHALPNTLITAHLLDACVATGRLRFVHVSTAEVTGPSVGGDERSACRPSNPYAESKLSTEAVVRGYADRLDVVIARPTGVYGPGERFFFYELMNMVTSGLAVVAPSPLSGRVTFVHVDDVVGALTVLATHGDAVGGTFNISADAPASLREIVETIAHSVGVPRPKVFLPTTLGVCVMTCIAPLMNLGKRRVFLYHPRTVRESVQDRVYSNRRLRGLGFRPRFAVLDGVRQTVGYELEHGGLKKGRFPAAWERALHVVSVTVFAVLRWAFGRRPAT